MFSNIKEGDLVLVPVSVKRNAFERGAKKFWCSCKVSKTTPKRFTANNQTYSKNDGSNIKASEPYRPSHPSCKVYSSEANEIKEYQEYKKYIASCNEIITYLPQLNIYKLDNSALEILKGLLGKQGVV